MRIPRMAAAGVMVLVTVMAASPLPAENPELSVQPGLAPGTVRLAGSGSPDGSHRVELSYGLEEWWPVYAVRETPDWSWGWDEVDERREGFFRMVDVSPPVIAPHSSWKDQIILPGDAFLSKPLPGIGPMYGEVEVRWVKFALILDGLPKVYFQESGAYPFHFDFARERLSPFAGMNLEEFNGVSLHRGGQEVVLGAVLWAPGRNEYGIQLVGQDEYPREMVRFLFGTVDDQLTKPEGAAGFYMPTFEQAQAAERDRAYLGRHGIAVSSPERWVGGSVCYAPGWGLGRLVFVTASEIDAAYRRGDLQPTDILLTDGVPAEVPFVAGIISLVPATPNSHVVILAQSYGIPFVYLREPSEQGRVRGLVGREVVLRSCGVWGGQLGVHDVDGIDPAYRAELVALKEPLPIEVTPTARFGAFSISNLDRAVPEDIQHIGGKAANFGFLRRVIPAHAPEALAFTFDLWDAYLDQVVTGGRTLREEISSRLTGLSWPMEIAVLDSTLEGIRDLIKDEADFNAAQKAAILSALSGLDEQRKVRFRSSTNVEDSGVFVGAGLYDSYSGCIGDDTDGDEAGPSHCDPTEAKERGVFRAMRKVFASFYNLNAFIERLRHGVEESEVGMAILVHYSFPDELEAANGVATSRLSGNNFLYTTMVSQVGAESVTNPSGGSLPEIVELQSYRPQPNRASLFHHQRSNRLLLGEDTVMEWEQDYQDFGDLFFALIDAYKAHFSGIGAFTLEFEYKKLTDGSLVVKQIRQVPQAQGRPAPGVALINSPLNLQIFQGEAGTVFGNHRLKSLWQVESDSRWVDPADPAATLVTAANLEYAPQGEIITRSGAPWEWPGARFDTVRESTNLFARDRWDWPSDGGETVYELWFQMPAGTGYQANPLHTLGDFWTTFHANYEHPLPDIDFRGEPTTTRREVAVLTTGSPDDPLPTGAIRVQRMYANAKEIGIETTFYWPPPPTGIVAGYTAPLIKWVGTTITGLSRQPIALTGYYSQTYRPGHHNFSEEFLFEPGLEPGMPASILEELRTQNIRMIYLSISGGPADGIKAVGFDGVIRDL